VAVPIENIYYLLCYAWDRLKAPDTAEVSAVANNRIENLLAKVLVEGVSKLVRCGLDRGYVADDQVARRIRGKLLVSQSLKRSLFETGRAECRVDEFSYDVPHNRVIKAALAELSRLDGVDESLRIKLLQHRRLLAEVSDVDLTPSAFRQIQLHRNNARYAFLINVCELLCRNLIPDERGGGRRFQPFNENEQVMGALFEAFVRNFLKREQEEYRVSRPKIGWDVEFVLGPGAEWLPEMQTDVFLESPLRRVVIETKFYAKPVAGRFENKSLISAHLYQLLNYLEHLSADGPPASGMLLYAGAGPFPALDYRLGQHHVQIRTLELAQGWQDIHRDLLALLPSSTMRAVPLPKATG